LKPRPVEGRSKKVAISGGASFAFGTTKYSWGGTLQPTVQSAPKGTMYFIMHPHGINMSGRWVGLSYDGVIVTGWAGIARTEEEARGVVTKLREGEPSHHG